MNLCPIVGAGTKTEEIPNLVKDSPILGECSSNQPLIFNTLSGTGGPWGGTAKGAGRLGSDNLKDRFVTLDTKNDAAYCFEIKIVRLFI